MIILAAAIAAATPQGSSITQNSLWRDVTSGRTREWNNRTVSLSGTVVVYAIGSVFLLPLPPRPNQEGGWDFDRGTCVGLMLSPAQFQRVRTGYRVAVRGRFVAINLDSDRIITSISRRGRTAYPQCTSVEFVAPFIDVDALIVHHP
jgi:hypothetical protein